jgi:hypothetical protein
LVDFYCLEGAMPAAYTHITLVNILKEPQRLQQIPGVLRLAIPAVLDYFKFCELSAVIPNYPFGDEPMGITMDSV